MITEKHFLAIVVQISFLLLIYCNKAEPIVGAVKTKCSEIKSDDFLASKINERNNIKTIDHQKINSNTYSDVSIIHSNESANGKMEKQFWSHNFSMMAIEFKLRLPTAIIFDNYCATKNEIEKVSSRSSFHKNLKNFIKHINSIELSSHLNQIEFKNSAGFNPFCVITVLIAFLITA